MPPAKSQQNSELQQSMRISPVLADGPRGLLSSKVISHDRFTSSDTNSGGSVFLEWMRFRQEGNISHKKPPNAVAYSSRASAHPVNRAPC